MKIFELIDELKEQYRDDSEVQKTGTLLLGVNAGKPLVSKHEVFKPLEKEILDEHINLYKRKFPEQLYQFYRYANGCRLFLRPYYIREYRLAHIGIAINGFQTLELRMIATPELLTMPFDLITDDLRTLKGRPDGLLKAGSIEMEGSERKYIYINTENNETVITDTDKFNIIDRYENLDECLCSLFNKCKQL